VVASVLAMIVTCGIGIQLSSTSDSGGSASAPTSVDSLEVLVSIFDFRYSPGNVSVPRGAEVTWVNDDKAQHTATERSSQWDTGALSEGESRAVTFTRPGTYSYYCTIHPYMEGTITVR
jgi:plastocyanin